MNLIDQQAAPVAVDLASGPAGTVAVDEVAQLRLALAESEARWQATVEQSAVGMAHIGLDGHWLWVNQQLCTLLGYRANELVGGLVPPCSQPADWTHELAAVKQIIAGALPSYVTHKRHLHRNGSTLWGRLTLSLARTPAGLPAYLVAVVEDITALKQTEEALQASEERYRHIVDDQDDLICRFQPDCRLTFVNRAYAECLGKTPAELVGASLLDLVPTAYHDPIKQHLTVQNPTGRAAVDANPLQMPDGSVRWFEWINRAIVDAQGVVIEYQAVGRDITAHRQAVAEQASQRQFTEALLNSLAALTGSLDVEEVMAQILASAATVVPSDAGSIILVENGYGRVAYCRGFSPEVTEILQQELFSVEPLLNLKHALTARAPYVVHDTRTSADWIAFPLTNWIRASIGIPIECGGQIVGLLVADSATPNFFTAADVTKLQVFAQYASLALNNAYQAAWLEQQVAERTAELQTAKDQVEAIFNHSSDAILLVYPDLSIVRYNAVFGSLFAPQTPVSSLLTLIHPADHGLVRDGIALALSTGGNHLRQVRAARPDGPEVEVELSISPMNERRLVCTLRDITERKRNERQLRFYASLQESVNEAVITVDLEYKIQSWNKAAETIYGWQAAEVIGRTTIDTLQTLYDSPEESKQLEQILFQKGYWQGEIRQRCKDGSLRNIWGSLTVLRDAQQTPIGLVAIGRDITAQKQMASALEESRHFAQRITDTAPNIIFVYDLQTHNILYANRYLTTVLGYTLAEVSAFESLVIDELIHPEDRERLPRHLQELSRGQEGQIFYFECRLRHKQGSWRWFGGQDTVFQRAADGRVTQGLGVATDITEQKLATQALRKQRDFLQQIIDNVPALIMVKDRDGRFQLANRRAAQIYSITPAEMVGKVDSELNANQAEVAFFRQKDQEALTSGQPIFIPEQTILGTYYQTNKIPLKNDETNGFEGLLIASVDISTHKQAELALRQALQAEKALNEHKSSFITTTSHEFRTPLAAILSLTETLTAYRHKLTDDQIEQRLVKIKQQVERLKTLMTDVLELERIQAHRVAFTPVEVDPNALCCELISEFQNLFSITQRLIYQGADAVPVVKLDKRLLHHIITNLLSNAVKYSPADSTVTLTLTHHAETLILQVADQGIGIPAADLPHLFQPFQRASNVGAISGTGLGLAITKNAVALHGGSLTIASEPGHGTTVTVTIPVTKS